MKLVILYPRYYHDRKMSFVRRHVIYELLRTTSIRSKLSGQGWPDWRDEDTLVENVTRILPGCDTVWWYKPLGNDKAGVPPVKDCNIHPGIKTVASYNEAYWPNQLAYSECAASRTDVVICHHQNDMMQFGPYGSRRHQPRVVHIPHCANEQLFTGYSKPFTERQVDLLLTGVLSQEIYPLRSRIARMINQGMFSPLKAEVRRHPGYRLGDLESCRRQEIDYAKALGNARVAVVTASRYGYGLAKYPEAAMAGCCLLAEPVVDFEKTLMPASLPVSMAMSDKEIVHAVTGELYGRAPNCAEQVQIAARRYCTTRQYVSQFLQLV